jgi:hypothetical protein
LEYIKNKGGNSVTPNVKDDEEQKVEEEKKRQEDIA